MKWVQDSQDYYTEKPCLKKMQTKPNQRRKKGRMVESLSNLVSALTHKNHDDDDYFLTLEGRLGFLAKKKTHLLG